MRNYTEKQQKFLDVLFEEAEGNVRKAMDIAGYGPNTSTRNVLDALPEEIDKLTRSFLNTKGRIAATWALVQAIDKPTELGTKEKLAASKDVLDRTGLIKEEKIEIKAENPVFILPSKSKNDNEVETS